MDYDAYMSELVDSLEYQLEELSNLYRDKCDECADLKEEVSNLKWRLEDLEQELR